MLYETLPIVLPVTTWDLGKGCGPPAWDLGPSLRLKFTDYIPDVSALLQKLPRLSERLFVFP